MDICFNWATIGFAVISAVVGFLVGMFANTKSLEHWHDESVSYKYALNDALQACREVLNVKQFDRVRRRALEIGAELAKVNTLGPKHIPGDISLYKAYAECRAIASEEGANNER